MKRSNVTFKLSLVILLVCFFVTKVNSQTYAEQSQYSESFSASELNTLEIVNKYGSIHVKNWDKDSILITTDVYLSSSSVKKLNKLKEAVTIKYSKRNTTLLAHTLFDKDETTFIKEFQSLSRKITPSTDKSIEINYNVFLPQTLLLTIENQYGDVFLENIESKLNVKMANGAFKANNINANADLDFKFVQAMLNDIKEGHVKLKYSKIHFNKSVNINIESKSSDIFADDIGVLKLKSSRDNINIGNLDYMYGSASYTDIMILKLGTEVDGHFTYGQITIDKMSANVSLIDIDSERTDIKLYVPKKICYSYDILHNENADVLMLQTNIKDFDSNEVEGMKVIKGKTCKNPSLDIRIRALKRCLIQMHHVGSN